MNAELLVLERNIREDLAAIAKIYQALPTSLNESASGEALIVASYHLNNLYNAAENIFRNIATTFENSIDDKAGWHSQLLQRMRLDLSPLRPALIDRAVYDQLDELRRFRHLFRSAYTIELDADRLRLVLDKALALKEPFCAQIERFLKALTSL